MTERKIRLDDAMGLIREKLDSGHEVTFSPRGTSMLPFLKEGRDTVTLAPPPKRLKKYDIPLYRRKNGQYVLHRAVKVDETYTCIGDNQFTLEYGIEHEQIIGVCSSFVRNGRKISTTDQKWLLYAKIWHFTRPIRHLFARVKGKIARILKH